jgi:hypothetical protein
MVMNTTGRLNESYMKTTEPKRVRCKRKVLWAGIANTLHTRQNKYDIMNKIEN